MSPNWVREVEVNPIKKLVMGAGKGFEPLTSGL